MSHVSQGQAGVAAVAAKRYDEAIPLLTKATAAVKSPIWLLALAQAHQQKGDIAKALEYTGAAYESALGRANRRNMIDAQYRRAVLLYRLGRFADADVCAVWSQMLIEGVSPSALASYPGEQEVDEANGGRYKVSLEQVKAKEINTKQAGSDWSAVQTAMGGGTTGDSDKKRPPEWNKAFQWRIQSLGKLEQLATDDPAWLVSVKPAADGAAISAAAKAASPAEIKVTEPPASAASKATLIATAADPPRVDKPAAPITMETLKPKVDFYQTAKAATLSVYIKDVDKEKTEVKYLGDKVVLGPLKHEANPTALTYWVVITTPDRISATTSRHSILSRKVELVLEKGNPGVKWPGWGTLTMLENAEDLEKILHTEESSAVKSSASLPPAAQAPSANATKQTVGPPAYPTSSKRGPQNWDGVAKEAGTEEDKDVDDFFKTLYKDATPEQQRAMMKSFVESNGTALSTDWNDVKGRTVETHPPDGVEARKWES